jgi:hypothetical protein
MPSADPQQQFLAARLNNFGKIQSPWWARREHCSILGGSQ